MTTTIWTRETNTGKWELFGTYTALETAQFRNEMRYLKALGCYVRLTYK